MNVLCSHHAKTEQACRWVIANTPETSSNLTEQRWREACIKHLESLSDGPDMASTWRNSEDGNSAM